MKDCKDYLNEIIQFEDLDRNQKRALLNHIKTCDVCTRQWQEVRQIEIELQHWRVQGHPDTDTLSRYGLSRIPGALPAEEKLSRKEIKEIQSHLDHCSFCQATVEAVQEEFANINGFLEEAGVPDLTIQKGTNTISLPEKWLKNAKSFLANLGNLIPGAPPRLILAPVAAVTLLVVIWFSPVVKESTNPFYSLAEIRTDFSASVTRASGTSPALQKGMRLFQEEKYSAAAQILEQALTELSDPDDKAYIYEWIGMSYLLQSESSVLGKLKHFRPMELNKAIKAFQKALQLTQNLRLREDALWYMGKAFLRLQQPEKARETFSRVAELKGPRYRSVIEMLDELSSFE